MGIDDLSRRPWVLLGGTLCTDMVFDGMLDALGVTQAHRHPVTLDLPKIEDYARRLEDLPPGSVVCGFSLGAIVAAHYADRLSAHHLILFGVNPFADDPAKAASRHDLAKNVGNLGGAAALDLRTPDVFGATPDQTRAIIYQMADATAGMIAAQTRLALTRPGAVPALARARMPVFALTGTQDTSAPPNHGRAAAQAAPDGHFAALDGLGHFAPLEDPNACATALLHLEKARYDTA